MHLLQNITKTMDFPLLLHVTCFIVFDQLKDTHNVFGIDNLLCYVKFSHEAYQGINNWLCHGVSRKYGEALKKNLKN